MGGGRGSVNRDGGRKKDRGGGREGGDGWMEGKE